MTPPDRASSCPECELSPAERAAALDRRGFIRTLGALAAVGAAAPLLRADTKPVVKAMKPAEELIRELVTGLSAEQKKKVILPWDFKADAKAAIPSRLGMYNAPINKTTIIKDVYTKPQQDLLMQIFKAIGNGEEGYKRLSRGGDFDASGAFENIGACTFGDPIKDKQFSFVFAGHHLTIRCDGNSEPGAAFGGPMYYGHTPNGYADDNVFYYQTVAVKKVFDALDGKQRKAVVIRGTPGEQAASVKFRKKGEPHPGMMLRDMSKDQQELVFKTMRELVSPFRKEDGDEVMEIVKANGGAEVIHLAFYEDPKPDVIPDKDRPWHFWRLEGPGFVWNFRVLPHVHTFVNISSKV